MRRCNNPEISITKNPDECTAVTEGLNLLSMNQFIKNDDTVVITPNFVRQEDFNTGTVSGIDTLKKVIQYIKNANPKRIVLATGSGQKDTSEIINSLGIDKVIKDENIEFIDLNKGPFTRIKINHDKPCETNLNKIYEDMTFLISFTQLKQHEEATMSGCIKNIALSWPPAEEHGHPKMNMGIHEKLHDFISAFIQKMTIDLSILSASPAMIGTGPAKGIAKHTDLVVCGTDPVAVDTIGARLLGFKPQAISYLYQLINAQYGIGNTDNMNIKGIDLKSAEEAFSNVAFGKKIAIN